MVGGLKVPKHQRLWVKEYITFELSTGVGERVDFASREWEGGGAEPQLEIVFNVRRSLCVCVIGCFILCWDGEHYLLGHVG